MSDVKGPAYQYRAKFVRNWDGDTVRLDISLGFGVWLHNQVIRIKDIDAPERRGDTYKEAMDSQRSVEQTLLDADDIVIETYKDKTGKYGRWIADIWFREGDRWLNLGDELVDHGLAVRKEY
jgi:micrococcal nuclease